MSLLPNPPSRSDIPTQDSTSWRGGVSRNGFFRNSNGGSIGRLSQLRCGTNPQAHNRGYLTLGDLQEHRGANLDEVETAYKVAIFITTVLSILTGYVAFGAEAAALLSLAIIGGLAVFQALFNEPGQRGFITGSSQGSDYGECTSPPASRHESGRRNLGATPTTPLYRTRTTESAPKAVNKDGQSNTGKPSPSTNSQVPLRRRRRDIDSPRQQQTHSISRGRIQTKSNPSLVPSSDHVLVSSNVDRSYSESSVRENEADPFAPRDIEYEQRSAPPRSVSDDRNGQAGSWVMSNFSDARQQVHVLENPDEGR